MNKLTERLPGQDHVVLSFDDAHALDNKLRELESQAIKYNRKYHIACDKQGELNKRIEELEELYIVAKGGWEFATTEWLKAQDTISELEAKVAAADAMEKAIYNDTYCSFHTNWTAQQYRNIGKVTVG